MKRNAIILFVLLVVISCGKGEIRKQTESVNDYSKEIIGCWKVVDMQFELKSNYPKIDSILEDIRNPFAGGDINEFYTMKFFNGFGKYYEEEETEGFSGFRYKIENNRLYMGDSDFEYFDLSFNNDTLLLITDYRDFFEGIVGKLKWDYKVDVPKDIKPKKLLRYVTCIRIEDCDKYKE